MIAGRDDRARFWAMTVLPEETKIVVTTIKITRHASDMARLPYRDSKRGVSI